MPLTVDDLVEHLNMPGAQVPAEGTPRRRELERALRTAVEELTRMTGLLDATTATATVAPERGVLRLPYVRLTSVVVRDPYGGTVAPSSVDLVAGLVALGWAAGSSGAWTVDCTRTAAWPAALETAALEWAAHSYETQRTTLNPAADDDEPLPSFALPNRVAQFARPYMLPGIA